MVRCGKDLTLLPFPSVSFTVNYQLSSIILLSLCFQGPHSCDNSLLLWPNPLPPPLSHSSKFLSIRCSLSTRQLFNPFFPHSQPLIDLLKATTASHHFPFPLFLLLFCWSVLVGEEEWEMKVGDSLSPCQVAAQRHRVVQRSWRGLKICWTHEKLATFKEGAVPEGRPNVEVVSTHHLVNAVYAKNWKAGGGSTGLSSCWVVLHKICANYHLILNHYLIWTVAPCGCFAFSSPDSRRAQAHEISICLM